VPAIGLLPVLAATVLATQGAFLSGTVKATPTSQAGTTQPAALAAPVMPPQPTPATIQPETAPAVPPTTQPQPTTATTPAGQAPQPTPRETAQATDGGASATSTTTPPGPFVAYRVKSGDTVRFIAQLYGVSPASIAQASGLANPDLLRVGQVLTVPAQPGWLYRLQPGETLEQVAARTGVPSGSIASASGLSVASVGVGDVILIPDRSLAQVK
jgi:LysM repeat protein